MKTVKIDGTIRLNYDDKNSRIILCPHVELCAEYNNDPSEYDANVMIKCNPCDKLFILEELIN